MADPSESTQVSVEPEDSEASELLGAVQTLSAQVGGLQAELHALRSQVRPLPDPPTLPAGATVPPPAARAPRGCERSSGRDREALPFPGS